MSFEVPVVGNVAHLPPRPAPPKDTPASGGFAKVYSLAERRAATPPVPEIPTAVWDEVARAAAIVRDLETTGRTVRFHDPEPGGRVRVDLTDAVGAVRPLSLGEVISIGSTEPPTAA